MNVAIALHSCQFLILLDLLMLAILWYVYVHVCVCACVYILFAYLSSLVLFIGLSFFLLVIWRSSLYILNMSLCKYLPVLLTFLFS